MMLIELADLIHYGTIACTVGISSIGVGIGEGITSNAALDAMNKQPAARDDISKAMLLGIALIETPIIMGCTMAILLLGSTPASPYGYIAELGIMFSICFSSLAIGLLSAFPSSEACYAIARQPFSSQKVIRFMLLTQSILQSPVIFSFIVAIMIKNQAATIHTLAECLQLIASGVCIGVGSIGPAIGLAHFAKTACRSIGVNREAYNKLFSFMLVSQAMIETPIIFSLVIAMLILMTPLPAAYAMTKSIALCAAALCVALGMFAPGISAGRTTSASCEQIAHNPELYETFFKLSMISQGFIDTSAIYVLLISLMLIYWF